MSKSVHLACFGRDWVHWHKQLGQFDSLGESSSGPKKYPHWGSICKFWKIYFSHLFFFKFNWKKQFFIKWAKL